MLPVVCFHNYLLECTLGVTDEFTVDKNGNVMGTGNSSVGGTLTVTGNATLNGSLTQTVGGSTKFSVDTSGNIATLGYVSIGTNAPYQAGTDLTIDNNAANIPSVIFSSPATIFYMDPYVTNGAYNPIVVGNDMVFCYQN